MSVETTLDGASSIRTQRQAEEANTSLQANTFGSILEGQSVVVRKNSAGTEIVQPRINLIEGDNVAITIAEDTLESEADITLSLVDNPDVASLKVAGTKVVGAQGAAVADATGGVTVDTEARAALNALLARLRAHGLIAT